jgi:hypothetical protein
MALIAVLPQPKLFQNHVDGRLFQSNLAALPDHVWFPATVHTLPVIALEA